MSLLSFFRWGHDNGGQHHHKKTMVFSPYGKRKSITGWRSNSPVTNGETLEAETGGLVRKGFISTTLHRLLHRETDFESISVLGIALTDRKPATQILKRTSKFHVCMRHCDLFQTINSNNIAKHAQLGKSNLIWELVIARCLRSVSDARIERRHVGTKRYLCFHSHI